MTWSKGSGWENVRRRRFGSSVIGIGIDASCIVGWVRCREQDSQRGRRLCRPGYAVEQAKRERRGEEERKEEEERNGRPRSKGPDAPKTARSRARVGRREEARHPRPPSSHRRTQNTLCNNSNNKQSPPPRRLLAHLYSDSAQHKII